MPQKRLNVPQKRDLRAGKSCLFPKQPHQTIALGSACRIAMPACRQDQPTLLSRNFEGAVRLNCERIHYQTVSRIDIIVEDDISRGLAPSLSDLLSESLALPQTEIERSRFASKRSRPRS